MNTYLCVFCMGKGTALPTDPLLQEKFFSKCQTRLQMTKLKDMMSCPACLGIGWIPRKDDV